MNCWDIVLNMLSVNNMIYFSSLLQTTPTYKPAADNLFAALDLFDIKYKFISNTKDIWVRDFMPVKTGSGKYISFRYEPSYLYGYPELRTDYRKDIAREQGLSDVTYSDINLDGGKAFSQNKMINCFSCTPPFFQLGSTFPYSNIFFKLQ